MNLTQTKFLQEWDYAGASQIVSVDDRLHGHYMAPLGFMVCGIGSPRCNMKLPEWVEGQVSDDS